MPPMSEWVEICRANQATAVKHALRQAGWVRKAPSPVGPELGQQVNLYWAEVCRARADKVAACLPSFGMVPTAPLGVELTKEVAALLPILVEQKWNYTKSPERLVWTELAKCLPQVSQAQVFLLAKAGQQETLSALLLRKAWTPTPAEFFEIAGAMEQNFGYKGDYMLEAAQQANPDLVSQATAAYRRSLERLLTNHSQLFVRKDREKEVVAEKEASLVRLCQALEPHGGLEASQVMARLADKGNLALVSVLGRVGCCLPSTPQAQKKFFAAMLSPTFEGEADLRLQDEPWGRWVRQAFRGAWEKKDNPAVVTAWDGWVLEHRLEDASPSSPGSRPRL